MKIIGFPHAPIFFCPSKRSPNFSAPVSSVSCENRHSFLKSPIKSGLRIGWSIACPSATDNLLSSILPRISIALPSAIAVWSRSFTREAWRPHKLPFNIALPILDNSNSAPSLSNTSSNASSCISCQRASSRSVTSVSSLPTSARHSRLCEHCSLKIPLPHLFHFKQIQNSIHLPLRRFLPICSAPPVASPCNSCVPLLRVQSAAFFTPA